MPLFDNVTQVCAPNLNEPRTDIIPDPIAGNDFTLNNYEIGDWVLDDGLYALQSDGVDEYLDSSYVPYLDVTYSISIWIKFDATTNALESILNSGSSSSGTPIGHFIQYNRNVVNQTLNVFVRNDAGAVPLNVESNGTIDDTDWHQILWVDDNGTSDLYIDASQDTANFNYTRSGTYTMDLSGLMALVRNTQIEFNACRFDEYVTWDRALSSGEATELFNLGRGSLPYGLRVPGDERSRYSRRPFASI